MKYQQKLLFEEKTTSTNFEENSFKHWRWLLYVPLYATLTVIILWLSILLAIMASDRIQRDMIFMNRDNIPKDADFQQPGRYGLSPRSIQQVRVSLGPEREWNGWWIKPEDPSTATHAILFAHGNMANRATLNHVGLCQRLSRERNAWVLAIDYDGFGERVNDWQPSEESSVQDLESAWKWMLKQLPVIQSAYNRTMSIRPIILGHSLGGGVVTDLTKKLCCTTTNDNGMSAEEECPRDGIILLAPFVSVLDVMLEYPPFAALMSPLRLIPNTQSHLKRWIRTKFENMVNLKSIQECSTAANSSMVPLLLVHGRYDHDISFNHSRRIFTALTGFDRFDKVDSSAEFANSNGNGNNGTHKVIQVDKDDARTLWSLEGRGGRGPGKKEIVRYGELNFAHHEDLTWQHDSVFDLIRDFLDTP